MNGTHDGIDCLESQIAALTAENERLRAELSHFVQKVGRLNAECDEHSKTVSAQHEMYNALRADNARLVESLEAEGARYEQWKREAERLKAEAEEEKRLREVWRSSSFNNEQIADRLRSKLSALRAAAKDMITPTPAWPNETHWHALRAAIAGSEEG